MWTYRTHDPDIRDLTGYHVRYRLLCGLVVGFRRVAWRAKKHPKWYKTFSLDHSRHRLYGSRMKKVW